MRLRVKEVEAPLSENTFTLDNPTSADSKYYFRRQIKMWEEGPASHMDQAFELLSSSTLDRYIKDKLFNDIINLGIMRYFEAHPCRIG